MMFLQFFTWGAWFVTLGQCLGDNGLEDFIGAAYGKAPIAAIIAPLFLGLIADRFFASQIVMGVLMLVGGGLLWMAPGYAEAGRRRRPDVDLPRPLAVLHADAGSEQHDHVRQHRRPQPVPADSRVGHHRLDRRRVVRRLPGLVGQLQHLPAGRRSARCCLGVVLLHAAAHAAAGQGQAGRRPHDVHARRLRLLPNPAFFVFMLCSTLICIPLAYYYGFTSNLLSQVGFEQPASTMTLGQMSEIFFMLLVPFFFRRLGVKWMILVGMAAWVVRYLLFAFGAPEQVVWMILAGRPAARRVLRLLLRHRLHVHRQQGARPTSAARPRACSCSSPRAWACTSAT